LAEGQLRHDQLDTVGDVDAASIRTMTAPQLHCAPFQLHERCCEKFIATPSPPDQFDVTTASSAIMAIDHCLRPRSPQNGNICEFSRRLFGIRPPDMAKWECEDGGRTRKPRLFAALSPLQREACPTTRLSGWRRSVDRTCLCGNSLLYDKGKSRFYGSLDRFRG
jgi:hypothetical protein